MAQLTLNLPLSAEDRAILATLLNETTQTTKSGKDAEAPAPKKRGRPPKVKEVEETTEDDDIDGDDDGDSDEESEDAEEDNAEGEDDDELSVDDEEEEKPAPKAKKAKGPTLEGDVIPAFQDYTKRHSRDKALAFLKKLGVKTVRDIPAEKYAKVIEALKKK